MILTLHLGIAHLLFAENRAELKLRGGARRFAQCIFSEDDMLSATCFNYALRKPCLNEHSVLKGQPTKKGVCHNCAQQNICEHCAR